MRSINSTKLQSDKGLNNFAEIILAAKLHQQKLRPQRFFMDLKYLVNTFVTVVYIGAKKSTVIEVWCSVIGFCLHFMRISRTENLDLLPIKIPLPRLSLETNKQWQRERDYW